MKTPQKICSVKECDRPHAARGYCKLHHAIWMRETAARKCSVESCTSYSEKSGLCGKHYYRKRMHGLPESGRTETGLRTSFVEMAIKRQDDNCLRWPYPVNSNGYARMGRKYVHQIICEQIYGKPNGRLETAHICGDRLCCNPRHLRWATHEENENDKLAHGTSYIGELSPHSRLSAADVQKIRFDRSISGAECARKYSVSQSAISAIRNNKTWRHIK